MAAVRSALSPDGSQLLSALMCDRQPSSDRPNPLSSLSAPPPPLPTPRPGGIGRAGGAAGAAAAAGVIGAARLGTTTLRRPASRAGAVVLKPRVITGHRVTMATHRQSAAVAKPDGFSCQKLTAAPRFSARRRTRLPLPSPSRRSWSAGRGPWCDSKCSQAVD